ncbi:uncharacterized protein DDB_G0292642-like [Aphidius gifuensis]|uniref:uncharacterized protein DDB_G0292642-like n=1 Tax=Aphidius gifuensis TaxID=684658 RepID=UPI001CDC1744|nr:uncharacterized protein DDB_G0292642-like [Aphidius gifuensis]
MENNYNDGDDDDDEVTIIKVVNNSVVIDENQQQVNDEIGNNFDVDENQQQLNDEIENNVDIDENQQQVNNEIENNVDEHRGENQQDENNYHNTSGNEEYDQMVLLQSYDIVPNVEDITCPICMDVYGPAEAVVLKDCLHSFCWDCLQNTIQHSETPEVRCPFVGDVSACESNLREREIKALVSPEEFEKHLAKSVTLAENKAGKSSFHCQTPNCPYWCFVDDNNGDFICTICNKTNCLKCQGVHDGKTCEEYQTEIQAASASNTDAKMSDDSIKEMLKNGTAMNCTTCNAVLQKISGCDHITCAACKSHLNWRGIGSAYWQKRHGKIATPNHRGVMSNAERARMTRMNNMLRHHIDNVDRRIETLNSGVMIANVVPHASHQTGNIIRPVRLNNTPPTFNQLGNAGGPIGLPIRGPVGLPIRGPVGLPIHGPVGLPIHGPVGLPIRGPIGLPIHGPVGLPIHRPVGLPIRGPIRARDEGTRFNARDTSEPY